MALRSPSRSSHPLSRSGDRAKAISPSGPPARWRTVQRKSRPRLDGSLGYPGGIVKARSARWIAGDRCCSMLPCPAGIPSRAAHARPGTGPTSCGSRTAPTKYVVDVQPPQRGPRSVHGTPASTWRMASRLRSSSVPRGFAVLVFLRRLHGATEFRRSAFLAVAAHSVAAPTRHRPVIVNPRGGAACSVTGWRHVSIGYALQQQAIACPIRPFP